MISHVLFRFWPLLLLPMVFLPWKVLARPGARVYLPTAHLIQKRPTPLWFWRGLFTLGGLFAIIGLFLNSKGAFPSNSLVVVLDNSGSMAELGVPVHDKHLSKLHLAKLFLNPFLKQFLLNGPMGVVTCSSNAFWNSPLTSDQPALEEIIRKIETRRVPGEAETNLTDALVLALNMVKSRSSPSNQILLITDGEHNVAHASSGLSPMQVGALAGKLGVPVHVLDMGTAEYLESEVESQKRKTSRENLQSLAAMTVGTYHPFSNPESISVVLNRELSPSGFSAGFSPWLHSLVWFLSGTFFLLSVLTPGSPWRRAV